MKTRRLFTFVLAATMCFSLTAPAWAEEGENEILEESVPALTEVSEQVGVPLSMEWLEITVELITPAEPTDTLLVEEAPVTVAESVDLTPVQEQTEEAPAPEPKAEQPAEPHEHSYGEPEWIWRRINGEWAALAAFRCEFCDDVQYIRAETITESVPGFKTTTAAVIFGGMQYSASRTDEILYFVTLDGITMNVYKLGEICTLTYDGQTPRDWYLNGELAAEAKPWFGFIVKGNTAVTTAECGKPTIAERERLDTVPAAEALVDEIIA